MFHCWRPSSQDSVATTKKLSITIITVWHSFDPPTRSLHLLNHGDWCLFTVWQQKTTRRPQTLSSRMMWRRGISFVVISIEYGWSECIKDSCDWFLLFFLFFFLTFSLKFILMLILLSSGFIVLNVKVAVIFLGGRWQITLLIIMIVPRSGKFKLFLSNGAFNKL